MNIKNNIFMASLMAAALNDLHNAYGVSKSDKPIKEHKRSKAEKRKRKLASKNRRRNK